MGAVLYQEFDGKKKAIAFASRGLNRSEQNYPAHKREFLALKWAMTDKFSDYLLGCKVTVVTDNNPLCYILKNAKLDATSHRWLWSLSLFDFQLRYKKGSTHIDADALSRQPHGPPEEDEEFKSSMDKIGFLVKKAQAFDDPVQQDYVHVSSNAVQAVCHFHWAEQCVFSGRHTVMQSGDAVQAACMKDDDFVPAVEQLVKDPTLIPNEILEPKDMATIDSITLAEWRKLQLADEICAR